MPVFFKIIDRFLRLIAFTVAYMAGRRSAEWEAAKAALEESNRAVTEVEKTHAKYVALKRKLSDFTE